MKKKLGKPGHAFTDKQRVIRLKCEGGTIGEKETIYGQQDGFGGPHFELVDAEGLFGGVRLSCGGVLS